MLAVAVDLDHVVVAVLVGVLEAGLHGAADAEVERQLQHARAGAPPPARPCRRSSRRRPRRRRAAASCRAAPRPRRRPWRPRCRRARRRGTSCVRSAGSGIDWSTGAARGLKRRRRASRLRSSAPSLSGRPRLRHMQSPGRSRVARLAAPRLACAPRMPRRGAHPPVGRRRDLQQPRRRGGALPALCAQLAPDDELIVVDNASTDGTLAAVGELAPGRRDRRRPGATPGSRPARTPARGRRAATCCVFLNPDATPAPGFVDAIRAPRRRAGARGWASSPRTRARGQHQRRRRALHRHRLGRPGRRPNVAPREVGVPLRRLPRRSRAPRGSALGGFSEPFFMYQEDVDLSLRLRLAGGRVGVEPAAVVDHDYEFAKGAAKWRMLERNRWATIMRTYPGALLLRCWRPRWSRPSWRCSWSRPPAAGCRRSSRRPARPCARCRGCCASGARSRRRGPSRPPSSRPGSRPTWTRRILGRAGRSPLLRGLLRAYWRVVLSALR